MTLSKLALLLIVLGTLALIGGCTEDCDTTTVKVQVPVLDYAGSDVCGTCHVDHHDMWSHSGHPYKLTAIDGVAPTADFPTPSAYQLDPTPLPANKTWDDFAFTIGGYGWKMRWITKDGFIYTPAEGGNQYNFEDESYSGYHAGESRPYDCGGCHTTGWVDSKDGNAENNHGGMVGFEGTFVEGGIGCEACHGMGTQHAFEPTTYVLTKDNSSEFCGKCHTRGSDSPNGVAAAPDIIEAKGFFIKHHEQYDEWYNSPHNSTYGPGCNDCHNPHASVKFDADAPGEGVNQTISCEYCHVDGSHANILSVNHFAVECVDCHMPDASKSAIANNIHDGDVSTHIWNINTSINGKVDMFSADQTSVVIDEATGWAGITLDFACYGCHVDPDGVGGHKLENPASMKTMQELVDKAATIHTLVTKKVATR